MMGGIAVVSFIWRCLNRWIYARIRHLCRRRRERKGMRLLLEDLQYLGLQKTQAKIVVSDQLVRRLLFVGTGWGYPGGGVDIPVVKYGRKLQFINKTNSGLG